MSENYIKYEKRIAIKSQVLADFVADWTPSTIPEQEKQLPEWIIYCDGDSGFIVASTIAIITSPSRIKMRYAVRLEFQCTNKIAEYEAVLLGLRKARAMGIQRLQIKTDSQVVAGHIEKDYRARDLELQILTFLERSRKTLRDDSSINQDKTRSTKGNTHNPE